MAESPNLIYESPESLYKKAVEELKLDQLMVQFSYKTEHYKKVAKMFEEVGDYLDAPQKARECLELAEISKKQEKEYLYQQAVNQKKHAKERDEMQKAMDMFLALNGYKDSAVQAQECKNIKAKSEKRRMKKMVLGLCVVAAFAALGVYIWSFSPVGRKINNYINWKIEASNVQKYPSLKKASVGDVVLFGKQEWLVLDKTTEKVLLTMNQAEKLEDLKFVPFHQDQEAVTWEQCSLRKWLNSEFIDSIFTEQEKNRILTVEIPNQEESAYGISGGNNTQDKIFILSVEEATKYKDVLKSIKANFWLRTPGNSQDTAAYMSYGKIMEYGYPVTSKNFYTYPAIYVSLE